jgi:hypothetical protein
MDIGKLAEAAREQGWTVSRTKRGHWRFVPPDPNRRICIFSGTPGDRRAIHNFVAQLTREGFIWPWEGVKR